MSAEQFNCRIQDEQPDLDLDLKFQDRCHIGQDKVSYGPIQTQNKERTNPYDKAK